MSVSYTYRLDTLPDEIIVQFVDEAAAKAARKNVVRWKTYVKDSWKQIVAVEPIVEVVEEEVLRAPETITDIEIVPTWIKFSEAAEMVGVRYQQVYQRAMNGRLEYLMIKDHWYAGSASIQEWIESRAAYMQKKGR